MKYKLKKEDIFDSQFEDDMTLREWQAAVWQYLVDHSNVSPKGLWLRMALLDKDEFFRRVKARRDGVFSRTSIKREFSKVQEMVDEKRAFEAKKLQRDSDIYYRSLVQRKLKDSSAIYRLAYYLKRKLNQWISEKETKHIV